MSKPENPEEHAKVVDAIKNGRIEFSPGCLESIASMDRDNPDFTITDVKFEYCCSGGFSIAWKTVSAGFGHTDVYLSKDKAEMRCDNEGMGREFLKSVFCKLVDAMVLEDEPKEKP